MIDTTKYYVCNKKLSNVIKEVLTIVFDLWTRSTRDLCKVFTSMSYVRELLWIRALC